MHYEHLFSPTTPLTLSVIISHPIQPITPILSSSYHIPSPPRQPPLYLSTSSSLTPFRQSSLYLYCSSSILPTPPITPPHHNRHPITSPPYKNHPLISLHHTPSPQLANTISHEAPPHQPHYHCNEPPPQRILSSLLSNHIPKYIFLSSSRHTYPPPVHIC